MSILFLLLSQRQIMETSYEWIPECYYRVSAKALIKNEEWKFLLGKEKKYWDIPGGWVDHGEDIHSSLQREIMEEMWIKIKNISHQPVYTFLGESSWIASPKRPLCIVIFEVVLENFNFIPSDEFQDFKFFDLQEALDKIELYHPNKKIFWEILRIKTT